jgi:hypothetical protein
MGDLLVFKTLEAILAQWQQAGAVESPDPYVKAAGSLGHADHYAVFEQLWQKHATAGFTEEVSDAQVFRAIAMAVLSGDAAAPDQIVRFMVLPWLRDCLTLGRVIKQNLGTWTGTPLGVALRPAHVRTLADQCIQAGALDSAKAEAILNLYELSGAPWRNDPGETPPNFMAWYQWSPHYRALLEDALRFWDSSELVPALASHLQAPAQQRQVAEILDRVRCITWILEWSGMRKSDLCDELRYAVMTIVMAAGPSGVAAKDTLAWALLGSYEVLCNALGLEASSPEVWYRAVADLIEGPFGGQSSLRDAWVKDIAGSLCGNRPGWHLIGELYCGWLDGKDTDGGIAEALATAFRQVHFDLVIPLSVMMWSRFEARIRNLKGDAANLVRQYLQTYRIVARESPETCRILLLARVLCAKAPAEGLCRLLLKGDGPTSPWYRMLADMIRTMPPNLYAENDAVGQLLWELFLVPRRREVSLMARLERLYNWVRLGGANPGHLAAVARVIGVLGDPQAGLG